jgi:putative acyl-CoA dehydrogenase
MGKDAQQTAFARVAAPVAKFFNCSRAHAIAYEARQCPWRQWFLEENPMAIQREARLDSMCMDEVPFSDRRNRQSRVAFEAT